MVRVRVVGSDPFRVADCLPVHPEGIFDEVEDAAKIVDVLASTIRAIVRAGRGGRRPASTRNIAAAPGRAVVESYGVSSKATP